MEVGKGRVSLVVKSDLLSSVVELGLVLVRRGMSSKDREVGGVYKQEGTVIVETSMEVV